MFIGHYAIGFAGKQVDQRPSLGTMFLAVLWLDLIWPVFVLLRIERFSIEPGNTVITPLDFEYYPWSHSLLMAVLWGLLFGFVYFFFSKSRRSSILLFFLVLSHWVLDWITHQPDLPFTPFSNQKTGLGLWNYLWIELGIEMILFAGAVYWYSKTSKAKNKVGVWSLSILVGLLVVIHFLNVFGPLPPNTNAVAWSALLQWVFVGWGYWVDRNRISAAK